MKRKIDRYEEVFTPGAPITKKRFFVGREQESADLKKILRRPGQHAIVIGHRGVGKTTLVKLALKNMPSPVTWRNCSPRLRYDTVFRDLLGDLGINISQVESIHTTETQGEVTGKPLGIGVGYERSKTTQTRQINQGAFQLTPWNTYQLLKEQGGNSILVIDEYDALGYRNIHSDFHESIAFTMKHLADHCDKCNARIIVVGIAYSAEALLGKHESIERSAREIYLKPLRFSDIADFLSEAESYLRVTFNKRVKTMLIRNSLGYPFFVHLVGLEVIDSMLARDRNAKVVTEFDYDVGLQKAVGNAFRSELRKFRYAAKHLSPIEKNIIKELALTSKYSPRRQDLKNDIMRKYLIEGEKVDSAIMSLQQQHHLIFLSRTKDDVRFMDPLWKPFLRAKIYGEAKKDEGGQIPFVFED